MAGPNKWYVTTPIYYVTARPHLGSLYSTLIADVITRYHKLKGHKTFFLTGTDEHGQKVAQAAEKAGKDPKSFVDSFINAYIDTWKDYEIEYSKFIRTTDSYHVQAVQQWLQALKDKGDIYKARYEGWYCTPDETFLTEIEVREHTPKGAKEPLCPSCGRGTVYLSEETYFFKLSAYQDKLLAFYEENPDFIVPKERAKEVVNFVKKGLKDLSISRTTVTWGIPFPGDSQHVTYVWADALNNYITGVGYGQKDKEQDFKFWWPADVHVMGKDIVRFHAIYWPAFLMASDLALPKQLLVHGWIKMDDQKMSKSLGNVVDPEDLLKKYGADPVRYYLMRQMAITHDGNFSIKDLEQTISSDLANDLGNLLNRMVSLAQKNDLMIVPEQAIWDESALALRDECLNMLQDMESYMDEYMFHMALARIWKTIHQTNVFFHAREPWKLVKEDRQAFIQIIAATCHALRTVAYALWPFMPEKMAALLASLGKPVDKGSAHPELDEGWNQSFTLTHIAPLFQKPEPREDAVEPAQPIIPAVDEITIDDVVKVHLVVGTIEACEPVENSDKLYKMQVNFGDKGMRQILGGIQKYYKPEQLIGKQGVFIYNLKPRKMVGLESQGMMLLAEDADGNLQMTTVASSVPNGTRLR
jgi:methionyl-tRNA synthetase